MTRKLMTLPAVAALALAAAPAAHAEIAVGLQSGGRALSIFDTASPTSVTTLALDASAPALDTIAYRRSTGVLFATSAESAPTGRRLFTVDLSGTTAKLTQVGSAFAEANPLENGAAADFDASGKLFYAADGLLPINGDPFYSVDPAGTSTTATKPAVNLHYADATDPSVGGIGNIGGSLYAVDTSGSTAQLDTLATDGLLTKVGPGLGTTATGDGDIAAGPSLGTTYAITGLVPMLSTVDVAKGTASGTTPIASPAITEFALQANGVLGVPQATASESAPVAVVTVTRTNGTQGPVKVDFETNDSTAKAGRDYTGGKGTLDFAAGEASKVILFPLANDGVANPDRSFHVKLSAPTGGAVLDPTAISGTVIITDAGANSPVTALPPNSGPVVGTSPTVKAGAKPSVAFGTTRKLTLKTFRSSGKRRVTFTCSSYCRADGTIKLGTVTIGKGTKTLLKAAGGSSYVDVKLTKLGKTRLGSKKARKITVTLKVTDTANQITTRTATISLTVPKAKKKR